MGYDEMGRDGFCLERFDGNASVTEPVDGVEAEHIRCRESVEMRIDDQVQRAGIPQLRSAEPVQRLHPKMVDHGASFLIGFDKHKQHLGRSGGVGSDPMQGQHSAGIDKGCEVGIHVEHRVERGGRGGGGAALIRWEGGEG